MKQIKYQCAEDEVVGNTPNGVLITNAFLFQVGSEYDGIVYFPTVLEYVDKNKKKKKGTCDASCGCFVFAETDWRKKEQIWKKLRRDYVNLGYAPTKKFNKLCGIEK